MFRLGNGSGFSGDRVDAPIPVMRDLVAGGTPAALFFETLGERTVALAHLEKRRDPELGYEPMLERLVRPILRDAAEHSIPLLGNWGAANPPAGARAVARVAMELGLPDLRIAVVEGDDVTGEVANGQLPVHEADAGLDMGDWRLVAANAYIGAEPLVDALREGAQVIVAGRTSDPALAIAPLAHHFGWGMDDWDRLAIGAAAGHLLECGSQVTGGVFWDPGRKDVPDPANLGFPIAEVTAEGSLVITKPANTGGAVDFRTIKEQLLYELHDPAEYITPDVVLDITGCTLEQVGTDRVALHGLRGRERPETLKVTASFEGSWLGEGEVSVAGPNAAGRARAMADVLLERLRMRGLKVKARVDLIGVASVHDSDGGALWRDAGYDAPEVRVRLAVESAGRDDADQAAREVLAMLCCGPAGTGGARWRVTPRILTQSHLILRERVPTRVAIRTAKELLR
ncbi:acyclic terpene utilization AtuA family protein [Sabulicella rubraurantiaca]|uniref:acyclic terpene utilization AtuA family protein n=1 Tax=Sabulicella rubraurantiaca TaxID=2811429 RepID=UPI001A96291A|nr:acyclic terpene utilization AtuA family protein [Sabulicella rubraurantiaca]